MLIITLKEKEKQTKLQDARDNYLLDEVLTCFLN